MKFMMNKIILSFIPIKIIRYSFNPILLYHSLGSKSEFSTNIDHVDLDILSAQLRKIQKYWKFVSIDEYVNARNKKGLASITIDDGYKNIIDESLLVFKSLNIPITIFINSSTFSGKIFWRDKIRFLIEKKLVTKFIKSSNLFKISDAKNIYSVSKNPIYNSIKVEKSIDKFLTKENIKLNNNQKLCFDNNKYLIKDNLIKYGNHTANHYMLSSLSKQEQYNEIIKCKTFLDSSDINKSEVFSLPFGGQNSFNDDTIRILEDLNYKKILKSTNNLDQNKHSNIIDRLMPKTYKIDNTLKKLYFKKIITGQLAQLTS